MGKYLCSSASNREMRIVFVCAGFVGQVVNVRPIVNRHTAAFVPTPGKPAPKRAAGKIACPTGSGDCLVNVGQVVYLRPIDNRPSAAFVPSSKMPARKEVLLGQ